MESNKQKNAMLNFLKSLFERQEEERFPVIQEMLERNEEELKEYKIWKAISLEKEHLEELLKKGWLDYTNDQLISKGLVFVHSVKSRGFIMHSDALELEGKDLRHFFDLMRDRTLSENYKTYLSDYKQFERKDHVEKVERHYLKPRIKMAEALRSKEPIDQLYGNVIIELSYINEKAEKLKFLNHPYTDSKYLEAKPFTDLVLALLG